MVSTYSTHPLFATMGFVYQDTNYDPPWNTYWWDPTNPIFTTPMTVPEFTSLTPYRYGSYGQRGDAALGFTPVAGYVSSMPTAFSVPGQAAMAVGNGGRTIFKGFLDGQNDANLNGNDWPDGEELWINMIGGMLTCPSAAVNDGSFENGPPPASAWSEWTNTGCEWIGDMSSIWGIPAYQGTNVFWAGGYCGGVPTTSYVEQSVTLPASSALTLKFWSVFYRPDADDPGYPDTFYVSVNGTQVFARDMVQANNTYPTWVQQEVDLTAYQGQTVTLRLGADSQGSITGNVLVDDLTLSVCPVVCSTITLDPATLPAILSGVAYSQMITAAGGTAPYTFAVTGGTLPAGLTLDPGGLLSGTPTFSGGYSFTITATDVGGCTGEITYTGTALKFYFLDYLSRSKFCVDTVTGAYVWNITSGLESGTTLTGTAQIFNAGAKVTNLAGDPNGSFSVVYDPVRHKASGWLITAAKHYVALSDPNTTDNPGACDLESVPEE